MNYRFSQATQGTKSSIIREILRFTQGKSIISFAGGLPAEEFFPVDAVRAACDQVFCHGTKALQYGLTDGFLPLRESLAARLDVRGIPVGPDQLILTTGSQQAIDLLCRIFLNPGDTILVQQPTYLAALQSFQGYQAQAVAVHGDNFGMDPADLEAKLSRHQPKFVYVCPTFSNPTGHSWSIERRLALLEVCGRHGVVIMEDDPYGDLYYEEGGKYPSIYSLDAQANGPDTGAVIYLGTFSKTVAPALRTGWAAADRRIIAQMSQAKQAADLHSSSLDQQSLYYLLRDFDLDGHLTTIRHEYGRRMLLMAKALRADADHPFHFEQPQGGMFLWVEVPEAIDTEKLLPYAVAQGVAFVPGAPFHAGVPQRNTARLNFTHSGTESIGRGVEKLKVALALYMEEHEAAQLTTVA